METIQARRTMDEEPIRCENGYALMNLARGESAEILARPAANPVRFEEIEHGLAVYIGDRLFTRYIHDPALAKPYLGPIFNSRGDSFTRLDLTATEHPHQRSLIIAVGDVNGIDFWNEPSGCGREEHEGYRDIICGVNYGSFTADNVWKAPDGTPLVKESRCFTFYAQSAACRYMDLAVEFRAEFGKVVFGATKEAGPLGIRVADSLRADHGGRIRNAYGAEGEQECWGRCASWCLNEGVLNGLPCGIAVFDHEDNERYPTAWHVRNYGLFAANNLFFKGGLTIEAGQSLLYRYRIVFYEGSRNIADRFLLWAK